MQKANILDKKHWKVIFKCLVKILEKGALLIFDCRANTKKNKEKILEKGYHYLTLKPKKKSVYEKYIKMFSESKKEKVVANGIEHECVKRGKRPT